MRPVLLLVDLQRDFLERDVMLPPAGTIVANAARLANGFREQGLAVLHAHTVIRSDGSNRMPHWKRSGTWACVEGTPGCAAPPQVAPQAGEPLFAKSFFSAFGSPGLRESLRKQRPDPLVVAGVYLHGCVRATVLDAYASGHDVWVASDAVGSADAVHAQITRDYLDARAADFLTTQEILSRVSHTAPQVSGMSAEVHPVACIGGSWLPASGQPLWERRNPSRWDEVLGRVPIANAREVATAAARAAEAQPAFARMAREDRSLLLEHWAEILNERAAELAEQMALEVGKPVADGAAEVERTIEMLRTITRLFGREEPWTPCGEEGIWARRRPVGVVALVTPWNNPVAIPAAKIAAALVFGNALVWKPALEAPRTSSLVMQCLLETACPPGAVNLVFGDALTAQRAIADPNVTAVSITGSSRTGRQAARACAELLKPIQAELGGNNAAVVCTDCDVEEVALELARSAFSFAGQRCTATRRLIVFEAIRERFRDAFVAAVRELRVGDPRDAETRVGPLISLEKRDQIRSIVAEAVRAGSRILCGGGIPSASAGGCWFEPTVLDRTDPRGRAVREESFGPLAVLLPVRDLEEALERCNEVDQGLVASLYTRDTRLQRRFLAAVEAGAVKLNRPTLDVHPEAPFGGWKHSGLGPPEHGIWDRDFYTRPQAVYGWDPSFGD